MRVTVVVVVVVTHRVHTHESFIETNIACTVTVIIDARGLVVSVENNVKA